MSGDYHGAIRKPSAEVATEGIECVVPEGVRTKDGEPDVLVCVTGFKAVAAGVAVQQAIHRHNRRGGDERLAVRVGISVGDVTFEGGDCFGLPVVEAQRLERAAAPGTVVCADVVALLARGRGGHGFRSLGALELRGLAQPVPASEVVLLAGEPGIGKTRLAAEIATAAIEQGAVVLAGRSDEDLDVAFQPFAAALRSSTSGVPAGDLADRLGSGAAELVRLWPEPAARVSGLGEPVRADPESERYALFEAVAEWLGAAGGGGPSLVVLDDLHWADAGSLLMLRRIIERAPAGLLVHRDGRWTSDLTLDRVGIPEGIREVVASRPPAPPRG